MSVPASSLSLPGMYPQIVRYKPKLGGIFNEGVGEDSEGNEYVLKKDPAIGVAEFVGAHVCKALQVRHATPAVVACPTMQGLQLWFGSVMEHNLEEFDRSNAEEWASIIPGLSNPEIFSTILAVDLFLGNDDRHAGNWLFQRNPSDRSSTLIAMDFSNAWPVNRPPWHPHRHPSGHTWSIVGHWERMGVNFDQALFRSTCARIACLDAAWLSNVLDAVAPDWLNPEARAAMLDWWATGLHSQLIDTIYALETDGEWS